MNQVHTFSSYFLKINFNVILISASRSLKLSFSFRFPHQIPVCIFLLWHSCHIFSLIHLDLFVLKYSETWVVLFLNLCLHGFYAHFLFVLLKPPEEQCCIFLYYVFVVTSQFHDYMFQLSWLHLLLLFWKFHTTRLQYCWRHSCFSMYSQSFLTVFHFCWKACILTW